MKRIVLTLSSLLPLLLGEAHGATPDAQISPAADGKEVTSSTRADCASAVQSLGYHPAVKVRTANAIYGCEFSLRELPQAVSPARTPTAAVAPLAVPPAAAPGARGMTAGCEAVVAGDFKFVEGSANPAVPLLPKPARGVPVKEPAFATCLVRATDMGVDARRSGDFVRNDYARRQAFNSDSSRFVAYELSGAWLLYDAQTLNRIKALSGPGSDAEFQWSATDPDLFYYTGTNGVGLALYEQSVSSGRERAVGDFGARLRARWPTAAFASTKSEGSPSADGRYWCFMVDGADWAGLGFFTWDRQTDRILAMADHPRGVRPDSVSMSPSGESCVWYGDKVVAFSRDLKTSREIGVAEHSDLAFDADGRDVLVSVDYSAAGNGRIYATDLKTGVRKTVIPTVYANGSATALHISGKAFRVPGWFLLSTYADYDSNPARPAGRQWIHRKVMAVSIKTGRVLQFAHTRVKTPSAEMKYWAEPHATVNRDFTRVLFNSNWDVDTGTGIEAFMIQIPKGAVK